MAEPMQSQVRIFGRGFLSAGFIMWHLLKWLKSVWVGWFSSLQSKVYRDE
jgi:hypothetical protein